MAHEGLWQQLDKLDRHQTAKRASCQYLTNPEHFVVRLLNTEYIVNLADRKISSVRSGSPPEPAAFLEQLCILAYLINARDLPLANKIVKAELCRADSSSSEESTASLPTSCKVPLAIIPKPCTGL